jgi:hypothetical protein
MNGTLHSSWAWEFARPQTQQRVATRGLSTPIQLAFTLLLALAGVSAPVVAPAAETLIPMGAVWKYSATGAQPALNWNAPDFDDSSWPAGAAQLGFGDGDETTVLNNTPGGAFLLTAYFRRAFNYSVPATNVTLRLRRDDGAVVYLNGVEIFRNNMPPGSVSYETLAAAIAADDGNEAVTASIPVSFLKAGANVLAVEVHQVAITSSDLSFDLELLSDSGTQPPELPTVTIAATDAFASEVSPLLDRLPDSGQFTVSRTGPTASALSVSYQVLGTAGNGIDYEMLSGQLAIPTGASSATINVNVLDDALVEPSETVVLRLLQPPCAPGVSGCYTVGMAAEATVTLLDNDQPVSTNVTLVAASSTWRYLDDGSDAGTAWGGLDFDDSTWKAGPAQLGYGDGDEATVVNFGSSTSKFITTYFRRAFAVADAGAVTGLTLRLLRDDGAVVSLNGVEVFRSNMPDGPVTRDTLALVAIGGAEETTQFISAAISAGALRDGRNVLAVEVHQVNPTSSDLSFDLELLTDGGNGTVANLPPTVAWVSPPRRAMFTAPTNIIMTAQASDPDGQVARVEFFAVAGAGDAFPTNRVGVATQASDSGLFSVVWSNPAPIGIYTVHAVAFDDRNASARSASNIIVAVVRYPVPPTVSLVATDAEASEGGGNPGSFRVRRRPAADTPLTVYFDVGGSAQNGLDYAALNDATEPPHVVIPAQATDAVIPIQPLEDDVFEGTELVTLTLRERPWGFIPSFPVPADGYFLTPGESSATVSIEDNDADSGDRELHAVGIYSGITSAGTTSHNNERGDAAVVVRRPGRRVTLVLSSYEPVLWHVTVESNTVLERIILGGFYPQTVTGVPSDVEQIPSYLTAGSPGNYLYLGTDIQSSEFLIGKEQVCKMTGLDMSSFHGGYDAVYPAPFVVDAVQADPVLRCDYPVASTEDLPDLRFDVSFLVEDSVPAVQSVSYRLSGPQNAARLFLGARLTPDSGQYLYGVVWGPAFRVDKETGVSEPLPLPPGLPELSWPSGMGYDSQRGRVLMVSFGGAGFLYGYTPSNGLWSVISSLNNQDLDSIVYHAAEDALYGVALSFGSAGALRVKRFTPDGLYSGAIELPVQPFSMGINAHRTHLVSVGTYLVLLLEPDRIYPAVNQPQESRIYLIDPSDGRSWLTYRHIHAPLPQKPIVQVIWPPEGITSPDNAPIPLVAEAFDPDGLVQTVEFFVDDVSVGLGRRDPSQARSAFFRLDAPSPAVGSHRVTARATDGEGDTATSAVVSFRVMSGGSEPEPTEELHAVGVTSGTSLNGGSPGGAAGHASVIVNRPGKRVTLFLSSYGSVIWHVTIADGTTVSSVILGGYYRQFVTGLSSNITVIPAFYDGQNSDYLDLGFEMGSAKFQTVLARLCQRTGQGFSSFQGSQLAFYPVPFVIDRVQLDARLRCDYPQPVAPERLPDLSFQLAFADRSARRVFVQNYTLAGPVNHGALLPATPVVTDARGQIYYGEESHEMFRIDAQTGNSVVMELGPDLPELSWPVGVTYDPTRRRVLLASLGGEGYLYGYSPEHDQWSLVQNLAGVDLGNVVYHLADDSLYAVEPRLGQDGLSSLAHFSPDGEWLGSLPLPVLPVSVGISGAHSVLVSVGAYLVWLVEWNDSVYPRPFASESRIYLIDPRTGQTSLTLRRGTLTDQDGDGVPDGQDRCPNSGTGIVDAHGCSLEQLCPCGDSRRDYVRCVIQHAWEFYRAGLITAEVRRALIQEAAQANCGPEEGLDVLLQPQNDAEIFDDGRCLILTGAWDQQCVLECSSDLLHWIPIQTNRVPTLEVEIIDRDAAQAPSRFYRLKQAQ